MFGARLTLDYIGPKGSSGARRGQVCKIIFSSTQEHSFASEHGHGRELKLICFKRLCLYIPTTLLASASENIHVCSTLKHHAMRTCVFLGTSVRRILLLLPLAMATTRVARIAARSRQGERGALLKGAQSLSNPAYDAMSATLPCHAKRWCTMRFPLIRKNRSKIGLNPL